MRLQNTYRLAASEIVDGKIPGDQKEMMSTSDCYYLGWFFSAAFIIICTAPEADCVQEKLLMKIRSTSIQGTG